MEASSHFRVAAISSHSAYSFKGPVAIAFSGPNAFVTNAHARDPVTEFNATTGALAKVLLKRIPGQVPFALKGA